MTDKIDNLLKFFYFYIKKMDELYNLFINQPSQELLKKIIDNVRESIHP